MEKNKGFTLVEMLVAMLIFAIITVPILLTFYIGATQVERQSGETKEVNIARETLTLIKNDLEKYASLATRIETNGYNITKLIIKDDEHSKSDPKRVVYVYDNDSNVLLRAIDDFQSVILSEEQLGDRYYKESQKEKYKIYDNDPVSFSKDDLLNTISVYIRIKTDQEAEPQEDFYLYNIKDEDRKVIKFSDNGYVEDMEKFNLRDSSFTIETYFKLGEVDTQSFDDRCLFNLVDSNKESKVKVRINSNYLGLYMNENDLVDEFELGDTNAIGIWRKLIITYDDYKKEIKMYISNEDDPKQMDLKSTTAYDTDKLFYDKSNGVIKISGIYLGNESNQNNNNFAGPLYMYEPRIWQKVLDIDKVNLINRLNGDEESLIFYIKDDYKKAFYDDKVDFEIVNAVSNKILTSKDVYIDEEIVTEKSGEYDKTRFDNISKLIGY